MILMEFSLNLLDLKKLYTGSSKEVYNEIKHDQQNHLRDYTVWGKCLRESVPLNQTP